MHRILPKYKCFAFQKAKKIIRNIKKAREKILAINISDKRLVFRR